MNLGVIISFLLSNLFTDRAIQSRMNHSNEKASSLLSFQNWRKRISHIHYSSYCYDKKKTTEQNSTKECGSDFSTSIDLLTNFETLYSFSSSILLLPFTAMFSTKMNTLFIFHFYRFFHHFFVVHSK